MRNQPFALMMVLTACMIAAEPTTTPIPTTQPLLKTINIHYSIYLARIDEHISITPDGLLRQAATVNKIWGPNDKGTERTEIRQGQLTPAQMAEVARLFTGWKNLSDTPYGNVTDGPQIEVNYGDKKVSGGTETPKIVFEARSRIKELADAMPIVLPKTP